MFLTIDQAIADVLGILSYIVMYPIWTLIIFCTYKWSRKIYKKRKDKGKKSWYFILLISVLTFVIVTGNWLPNEIYFKYACSQLSENNLVIYKTSEEWKTENQDLLEGKIVKFKINSKADIPQTLKGGYVLIDIYDYGYFFNALYEKKIFSRTDGEIRLLLDKRTGKTLFLYQAVFIQGRFFSPPLAPMKACNKQHREYRELITKFDFFNKYKW